MRTLTFILGLIVTTWFCPALVFADVILSLDMNASKAGMQNSIQANKGDCFDISLMLGISGGTKLSGYSVSILFDTAELDIKAVKTDARPSGWFELTAPVIKESHVGSNALIMSPLGRVDSINASNFAGSIDSGFSQAIAVLTVEATGPLSDSRIDLLPGFFRAGIDGLNDENGIGLASGFSFSGGTVSNVPEPSCVLLNILALVGFFSLRNSRLPSKPRH